MNRRNDRFVWDEDKYDANVKKHGITFLEAMAVFDDPHALYKHDIEHSEDEERFIVIGLSSVMRILVVCHCYRDGDVIRIISARKATKPEIKQYGG